MESKTADIIHETRKLNIRRKGNAASVQGQAAENLGQQQMPRIQTDYEVQLKASRDVRWQMCNIEIGYDIWSYTLYLESSQHFN